MILCTVLARVGGFDRLLTNGLNTVLVEIEILAAKLLELKSLYKLRLLGVLNNKLVCVPKEVKGCVGDVKLVLVEYTATPLTILKLEMYPLIKRLAPIPSPPMPNTTLLYPKAEPLVSIFGVATPLTYARI